MMALRVQEMTCLEGLGEALRLSAREAHGENIECTTDAACMLIAHQIAFAGHADLVGRQLYRALIEQCQRQDPQPLQLEIRFDG
jgi:hypothetical protein